MAKGALALLIHGGTENWSPQRWKQRFDEVCPDRPVVLLPDAAFDAAAIHYAAAWKPLPAAPSAPSTPWSRYPAPSTRPWPTAT